MQGRLLQTAGHIYGIGPLTDSEPRTAEQSLVEKMKRHISAISAVVGERAAAAAVLTSQAGGRLCGREAPDSTTQNYSYGEGGGCQYEQPYLWRSSRWLDANDC